MVRQLTDPSVLGLLELQHPLSAGQVVHLLKSFNLGRKKKINQSIQVSEGLAAVVETTEHQSEWSDGTMVEDHYQCITIINQWMMGHDGG